MEFSYNHKQESQDANLDPYFISTFFFFSDEANLKFKMCK